MDNLFAMQSYCLSSINNTSHTETVVSNYNLVNTKIRGITLKLKTWSSGLAAYYVTGSVNLKIEIIFKDGSSVTLMDTNTGALVVNTNTTLTISLLDNYLAKDLVLRTTLENTAQSNHASYSANVEATLRIQIEKEITN